MTCRCGTNFCYLCGGFYGKCECGWVHPAHPVPNDATKIIKPVINPIGIIHINRPPPPAPP
jgi:hypothetical protein